MFPSVQSLPLQCAAVDPRFRDLSFIPEHVATEIKKDFVHLLLSVKELPEEEGHREDDKDKLEKSSGRPANVNISTAEPLSNKPCTDLLQLLKRKVEPVITLYDPAVQRYAHVLTIC